jgi:predicted ribosome quality control (RQC) complex YloA/Tae2 family protein
VGLALYRDGGQCWLVLSADAATARVSFATERLAKAFAAPSSFVMLLRKHLEGTRLAEVRHVPEERVLILSFRGQEREARLVAEVMGKHSNVILVDESERVLGALKVVPSSHSRVRPIVPGREYRLPPARERDRLIYPPGERVDPLVSPGAFRTLLDAAPSSVPAHTALLGLLPGASPFLVEQILARAGIPQKSTLAEVSLDALLAACQEMYGFYQSRAWRPCSFATSRRRTDFAPYIPVNVSDVVEVDSISRAIDQSLGRQESHDALKAARDALLAEVERQRRRIARKLDYLQEGLEAAGEAEAVMQQGQLLLAYQHRVGSGATELTIPEMDISIPLDPRLSPRENAERLFRRYGKLRDARARLPELLAAAEAEAERLDEIAVFIRLATSEAELRNLEREFAPEPSPGAPVKSRREKRRGPARFTREGYTAIVGRSARENEEVTFRLARRGDLWLHARQRTGAHVIVQAQNENVPQEIVEEAARLAAYFSEGRNDSAVDVDVTHVRNVRKIPGGAPGRVTYRHFQTMHVQPGLQGWQPLSPSGRTPGG